MPPWLAALLAATTALLLLCWQSSLAAATPSDSGTADLASLLYGCVPPPVLRTAERRTRTALSPSLSPAPAPAPAQDQAPLLSDPLPPPPSFRSGGGGMDLAGFLAGLGVVEEGGSAWTKLQRLKGQSIFSFVREAFSGVDSLILDHYRWHTDRIEGEVRGIFGIFSRWF